MGTTGRGGLVRIAIVTAWVDDDDRPACCVWVGISVVCRGIAIALALGFIVDLEPIFVFLIPCLGCRAQVYN